MNILLVEDDSQDIFLVKEYFSLHESFKYSVSVCNTVKQATQFLQENRESIDLILLDLNLPDSQGINTFQKISKISSGTCIILLTGLDDNENAKEAIKRGAQDYLLKQDLTPTLLVRSVQYAIQREKITAEVQHLNKNLEKLVAERTAELMDSNDALKQEIDRNKKTTEALILSESKLTAQTSALEKKNTALKELLHQFEIEKKNVKKRVQAGIEDIVQPILNRMKVDADKMIAAYIELLENALWDIIDVDSKDFSHMIDQLSPKEIEVFQMVKSGMQSKEISRLLNISHHTVNRHRYNIRKKLGLNRSGKS